jgi:DNA-binding response OmpR family regulator
VIILLVEDDEMIRFPTAELMRDLGHSVFEAESAEQAMTILREAPIDVLVTDVGLPGVSGDVFAAEARAMRPSLRIVFATGMGHIPDPGFGGGGPVLLRKPYDAQSIEAALKAARA